MEKTDLIVRVKWSATINGIQREGTETEASWFMFDQRGTVFSTGPFKGPTPCNANYDDLVPLVKVGDEFHSIKELEEMKKDLQRYKDLEFPS